MLRDEKWPDGTLPTIGRWSPEALADLIASRNRPTPQQGSLLAAAAGKLLRDLDCHPTFVDALVEKLAKGAEIVRLAHQPNLFPYEQIHAQTLYLHELAVALEARDRPTVPIVFVVDYDSCSDDRIRRACAFDPKKTTDQRRFYSHTVKGSDDVLAFRLPAPNLADRAKMTNELKSLALAFERDPECVIANSGVERPANSLADFNLFAWVNLTINLWKLPILFVRLSDVAPDVEPERRALAEMIGLSLHQRPESLLWQLCDGCGARRHYGETCCPSAGYTGWTVPKILVDDLSDYAIYGVSGGTAYYRAANHLLPAHQIASEIGLDVAPEACWRIDPGHPRALSQQERAKSQLARKMLVEGKNSLLEHLLDPCRVDAFRVEMLAAMRDSTMRSSE